MGMIIFFLMEVGFRAVNVRKEYFNPGNRKSIHRTPPDKNTHHVSLEIKGSYFQFPVHYPESILQAAKKLKINIPYSCETGKCGSCVAVCKSGKVWQSNNEVLTGKDLSEGLVLTCTGH